MSREQMIHESRTSRWAGLIYLVVVVAGMFSLAYVPSRMAAGDPQAMLGNIVADEALFRAGVAGFMVMQVAFLLLPLPPDTLRIARGQPDSGIEAMARRYAAELARQVAEALHAKDPLAAHVRDELGIFEHTEARPLVAAGASALTFAVGAALPLAAAALAPEPQIAPWVTGLSLVCLAVLGAVGARAGGAGVARAVTRVTFWGAVAMAVTWAVGHFFGAVV